MSKAGAVKAAESSRRGSQVASSDAGWEYADGMKTKVKSEVPHGT